MIQNIEKDGPGINFQVYMISMSFGKTKVLYFYHDGIMSSDNLFKVTSNPGGGGGHFHIDGDGDVPLKRI